MDNMKSPPTLPCPPVVREQVLRTRRDDVVLAQGFTERELGTAWWRNEIQASGASADLGIVWDDNEEPRRLTRRSIGQLADRTFETDQPDDDAVLRLLWNVLIWGSGLSRRQNRRRIEAFAPAAAERASRIDLLRDAAVLARQGRVEEAYRSLIRRGGGVIPGLGPSFFTKFLYFSGGLRVDHRLAILDARVARSLHCLGWHALPPGYFNWYTSTYVGYCCLLESWAAEIGTLAGSRVVALDEIEYVLFQVAGDFIQ